MTADLRAAAEALERAGVTGFRNIAEGIDLLARHRDSHCADADRLAKRVEELKAQPDPAPAEAPSWQAWRRLRDAICERPIPGGTDRPLTLRECVDERNRILALVDALRRDPAPPAAASCEPDLLVHAPWMEKPWLKVTDAPAPKPEPDAVNDAPPQDCSTCGKRVTNGVYDHGRRSVWHYECLPTTHPNVRERSEVRGQQAEVDRYDWKSTEPDAGTKGDETAAPWDDDDLTPSEDELWEWVNANLKPSRAQRREFADRLRALRRATLTPMRERAEAAEREREQEANRAAAAYAALVTMTTERDKAQDERDDLRAKLAAAEQSTQQARTVAAKALSLLVVKTLET